MSTQTIGNKAIADLVIPLAAVRAKPRRFLSGVFPLQNRDGSDAIRSAGIEICWIPHRDENTGNGNTAIAERARRMSISSWSQYTSTSQYMVGALHVELESGQSLPAGDANGLSDPFCTLKIGEKRFVSSVKEQTLNPMWDEEFKFEAVTIDKVLHINCYDKV